MKASEQQTGVPNSDALAELLRTATIALDTNVLLNLFRYSEKASDEWFEALESTKERLVLPLQIKIEYLENLPGLSASLDHDYRMVEDVVAENHKRLSRRAR